MGILTRNNLLKSKHSFELPFSMIFAIIAGAVILFLAVYGATKFINTSQKTAYSESAKSLLNFLNPMVNSITSEMSIPIGFLRETRLYLSCSTKSEKSPIFGKQTLGFSEQSGFLKRWPNPGENISRYNKYIFSKNIEQGKRVYLSSKPFYIGYRVDDLIFINADKYCFVTPPSQIEKEIKFMQSENLNATSRIDQCSADSIKVCFGNSMSLSSCNISVIGDCNDNYCGAYTNYETGVVLKEGKQMNYFGNLLYAAIFSSPEIYECNLFRLGKKTVELGKVYLEEIDTLNANNCNSVIDTEISNIIDIASNLTSAKIKDIRYQAKLMDIKNCASNCPVYAAESC